jgi:site-specific recombinase XerD
MQRHAEDVRRRDLRELFDKCADDGIEREAERRRQTVGAMFRWALSQDIVETDPTAGLKSYDPGTPRDRVLSVKEIKSLWQWRSAGFARRRSTETTGFGRFPLSGRKTKGRVSRRSLEVPGVWLKRDSP